jgi:hypothetical protein
MVRPITAIALTMCGAMSWALATPARGQTNDAEAAVRAAAAAYLAALERGDAATIAACWTDDGVYIDAAGASHSAREMVQQEFANPPQGLPPGVAPASTASATAAPPAATPAPTTTIHFVGPTVAIEQSLAAAAPDAATQPAAGGDFIAAWVKQNDRWRLSLLREFAATTPTASPAFASTPLGELDWWVGSWTASRDGAVVDMTVEWTPDRAFLLQRFTATRDGREVRRGVQRIAWDAAAKQLRSWAFNADGSFSEAAWRKQGDVWVAASAGVLPDGRRQKSVHFWTPEGADACWFKSLNGEIDGKATDDIVLQFTRRRSEPAK